MSGRGGRLGKADEIFRRSPEVVEQEDPVEKIHVLLKRSQIKRLDEFRLAVRMESGYSLKRTELVRALVDLFSEMEVDPRGIESEEMLKDKIRELWSS